MKWIFLLSGSSLFALPQGPVVNQEATISLLSPEVMEIAAWDQAIIEWGDFSIDVPETVRFSQPSVDAVVLNRVIGSEMSHILGKLEANGKVILINPNGVLFGKEGRVDVASWMASTSDLQTEVFKEKGFGSFPEEAGLKGKIEVLGSIAAKEIALRARAIELQDGCRLTASSDYGGGTIDLSSVSLHIQPQAQMAADALVQGNGGKIVCWGEEKALHYGTITAQGGPLGGKGGFVEISGGFLDFSGTVKAPNGTLLLDPLDISISAFANNNVAGVAVVTPVGSTSCGPSTGAATFSDLNATTLMTTLDGGTNVIVSTAGSVGPCLNGDIYVIAPVVWSLAPSSLTLIAEGSIFVRDILSSQNAGGGVINLTANTGDIVLDAATLGFDAIVETIAADINVSAP